MHVGRPDVAHTRQPASAAVTASVTHRTNKIGAAEGFRTRGAEDARRTPHGVSPSTPPGVHHMRASSASDRAASRDMACVRHAVPPQKAATRAANFPAGHSAEKGPAGASWGGVLATVAIDLWPVWIAITPALLIEAVL